MSRETLPLLVMSGLTLIILAFMAAPLPRYATLLSSEDYAVYAEVLSKHGPDTLLSRDVISSADHVTQLVGHGYLRFESSPGFRGPSPETLEDFHHVDKHRLELDAAPLAKLAVVLTTDRELKARKTRGSQTRGVDVRIHVSRVGFNLDRTEALVYVEAHGQGSGGGGFHLLQKVDGRWQVRAWVSAWSWVS